MTRTSVTYPELRERVTELRAWAKSRVAWCDAKEKELSWATYNSDATEAIASRCEAMAERRVLRAVLRILDGEET